MKTIENLSNLANTFEVEEQKTRLEVCWANYCPKLGDCWPIIEPYICKCISHLIPCFKNDLT